MKARKRRNWRPPLRFGFEWKQDSVYTCDNEDMANLFEALAALKQLPWLPASVRDIRAFRVEQWSDFTAFMHDSYQLDFYLL